MVDDLPSRETYHLPPTDEELLEECRVETFRASGKGGQHVNKTESAVRLVHQPTGLVVTCRRERSQYLNKKQCLGTLRSRIEERSRIAPLRIQTTVPRSEKVKRMESKVKTGKKKALRRKPEIDTE